MSTAGRRKNDTLTAREREILGLLATGLSGAEIANNLVLSPETVRTHVRNAMAKLGASTRSQAVVMALRLDDLEPENGAAPAAGPAIRATRPAEAAPRLDALITGLAELHEIEAAAAYLADEDGLSLRLVKRAGDDSVGTALPRALALGEGPVGRAALERRCQLVAIGGQLTASDAPRKPAIVAPMAAGGRLVGVLTLATRASRPTGRTEILLAQAFATRVGEIIAAGGPEAPRRLARALQRFRASWSVATSG
jgi:DNA-binding CsgD family transcriptional regulator